MTAASEGARYRFVDKDSGAEFPVQQIRHEGPEVKIGDVVEVHPPLGKPAYFSVDSMVEGEIVTIHLVRARSQLWKTLLLLAILAASWFVIAYVLRLISSAQ